MKDFIKFGPRCADRDGFNSALNPIQQWARAEGMLGKLEQCRFWQMVQDAGFQKVYDSGMLQQQW